MKNLGIVKRKISVGQIMETRKIQIAQQAFESLAQGWATGNFQSFIDMLSDDVVFWLPVGKQREQAFAGADKQQFIAKLQERTAQGNRLIFHHPEQITTSDTTVTFEFVSQRTIDNQPVKARNVISFDIQGEKITGVREYLGDID